MSTSSESAAWNAALRALQETDAPMNVFKQLRDASDWSAEDAARVWQHAQRLQDTRKRAGAYYTSEAVARSVVQQSIAHMSHQPAQILEPSCGGGTLLIAALHEGARAWNCDVKTIAETIHAWDLDPVGILLAQWRVSERFGDAVSAAIHWHVGDALAPPPAHTPPTFAWILGNPPFGNAIDRATRRSKDERAHYARLFPLAARGAFDKCALFVELAAQRCAPGGHITFILPRSWLAQPASTHLRKDLATRFHLAEIVHLPDDTFFEASVSTIAITLADSFAGDKDAKAVVQPQQTAAPRTQVPATAQPRTTQVRTNDGQTQTLNADVLLRRGNWGAALHPFAEILTQASPALIELSGVADFAAGASTAEAYEWAPHVQDLQKTQKLTSAHDRTASDIRNAAAKAPETLPTRTAPLETSSETAAARAQRPDERALLIAGMIDPFHSHWGTKRTRYLGEDYQRPVLSLTHLSARRQALHTRPRALLPTLSVALEAFPDLHGQYIGAVSTISAWPLHSIQKPSTPSTSPPSRAIPSDDTPSGITAGNNIASNNAAQNNTASDARSTSILALCAVLNSAWCRLNYACLFASLALQGGNTQVSKNKLAALHIPPVWGELVRTPPAPVINTDLQAHLSARAPATLNKKMPSIERFVALVRDAQTLADNHANGVYSTPSRSRTASTPKAASKANAAQDSSAALHASPIAQHLVALLHADPATAMSSAHADILLLALAPELLRRVEDAS